MNRSALSNIVARIVDMASIEIGMGGKISLQR